MAMTSRRAKASTETSLFGRSALWLSLIVLVESLVLPHVAIKGLADAPAFLQAWFSGALSVGPWLGLAGVVGSLGLMGRRPWAGKLLAATIGVAFLGCLAFGAGTIHHVLTDLAPQLHKLGHHPALALLLIVPVLATMLFALAHFARTAFRFEVGALRINGRSRSVSAPTRRRVLKSRSTGRCPPRAPRVSRTRPDASPLRATSR